MSCGVGRRCGLDLVWLWLWCRPAAVALIGPLDWEPPYAVGGALKRPKKKKEKRLIKGQRAAPRPPFPQSHTRAATFAQTASSDSLDLTYFLDCKHPEDFLALFPTADRQSHQKGLIIAEIIRLPQWTPERLGFLSPLEFALCWWKILP